MPLQAVGEDAFGFWRDPEIMPSLFNTVIIWQHIIWLPVRKQTRLARSGFSVPHSARRHRQTNLQGGEMARQDYFNARDTLSTRRGPVAIYRLDALEKIPSANVNRLPFSIKVLLEAALAPGRGLRDHARGD